MTRSAPSGADAALIAALADLGLTVSQAQLERWRAAHYLPPHPREHLGRGRGTASHLLPQTVSRAMLLARSSRQGRALPVAAAWACWAAEGSPGGVARLRTAVTDELDRYGKRLAAGDARDDDSWQRRHNAAEAAARRVPGLDQHALLRAIVTTAARDPAAVVPLPRLDRGLALVLGRLLAGGGEDVGEDELLDALCRVFPEQAKAMRTAAAARDAAGHGGTWEGFGRYCSTRSRPRPTRPCAAQWNWPPPPPRPWNWSSSTSAPPPRPDCPHRPLDSMSKQSRTP
ncbi:hypothetical protein [Actinacidiphila acididurans]|uniref:Uncharacterized protein n=1 Tax=Actinacidiphila acididurans TaxID=2784346 RepID=A0ABS2TUN1_9ACTN|nr:hypothetical protein [Actinacidiphila acididurans]MBM9506787.1 hypothetical protein [Actinacidiphila acididurans]